MNRGLRAALVATVSATALAFAGSALAAYTPHLTLSHTPLTLSGGGTTDLTISFDQADDATAKATIYVPQGYTGTLGATAGTQLGTIDASILASQISPTQPLPLKGTIQTDDPAKYAMPATLCTGSATHEAVWLLRLQAAGTELAVPGYVDTVTAPTEAPLGAFKLQFCLPSPYIPQSAGGATFGAKLISATLHLSNVFSLPSQNGSYGWTVVATPYTVGTAVPNATGTMQARFLCQIPLHGAQEIRLHAIAEGDPAPCQKERHQERIPEREPDADQKAFLKDLTAAIDKAVAVNKTVKE